MKEFKVTLVETVEHEVVVNVNDENEIEDKVCEMLANKKVDFAKGKTANVQMYVNK